MRVPLLILTYTYIPCQIALKILGTYPTKVGTFLVFFTFIFLTLHLVRLGTKFNLRQSLGILPWVASELTASSSG